MKWLPALGVRMAEGGNLARAVALKALAAEVAARVRGGEAPDAVGADLLNAGVPPEAVDHAMATYETHLPQHRARGFLATVLCVVVLVGLPLAGAAGGLWAALVLVAASREPEPAPDLEAAQEEVRCGNYAVAKLFSETVVTLTFGAVGLLAGVGLGLAFAFPANRALSAWSMLADGTPLPGATPRH